MFAGQKFMIHMRDEIVIQMGQCTGEAMDVCTFTGQIYTFTGQSYSAVSRLGEEANHSL